MQNEPQIALKDLAFNKFASIDGKESTKASLNRLTRNDYPIDKFFGNANNLKEKTDADAVVVQRDIQLPIVKKGIPRSENIEFKPSASPDYWKNFKPIYPDKPEFWPKQLGKCVELRNARLAGKNPDSFYGWPIIMRNAGVNKELLDRVVDPKDDFNLNDFNKKKKLQVNNMNDYTLEDIAAAVNSEYPASIQQTFIQWMLEDNKVKKRDDNRNVILNLGQDFRSNRDFIGFEIRIAAINTWAFETVAPINFMLKWNYGMPRPEEVAYLVTKNKIKDDLTFDEDFKNVVHAIKKMNLKSQKDFTAYNKTLDNGSMENGSPTHPSFPAMHSAASTTSTWMPALFDLTPEQYEQALLTDYGTAMARTVAGVHYPMDNIAGLNVGQQIIRNELPTFVAERYGYTISMISARLSKLKFDWNDFDSKALTIKGVPAREHLKKANEDTDAKNLIGPVMHQY